jgi:predicted TIM-barrel fold metal-dependent hydrolase
VALPTVDQPTVDQPTVERYTIISADTHAGGSHAQYREYLEERYVEQFDEWRNRYRNPYKDLAPGDDRRLRNWDDDMRNGQQDADGVVGEVIFPNTVPPFFPGFVLFAAPPTPKDYELRLAGIRAHNRWLADFCSRFPERRAGIGQIFLNDIDDAIEDVKWIKEHNLRGGVLIQPVPPDAHDYIRPLNDPEYDRLWAVCEDLEVPVNAHGGVGSPSYPKLPSSTILHISELVFYSQRPLIWLLLSGVFERFPRLRYVITEQGGSWLGDLAKRLDALIKSVRSGQQGELRFTGEMAPPGLASEYIHTNVWVGCSFPNRYEVQHRDVVADGHWMWGSDFPHDEGTNPHSVDHIRISMEGLPTEDKRRLLAGNAAELYDFDLRALGRLAAKVGPAVQRVDTPIPREEIPPALLGAFGAVAREGSMTR